MKKKRQILYLFAVGYGTKMIRLNGFVCSVLYVCSVWFSSCIFVLVFSQLSFFFFYFLFIVYVFFKNIVCYKYSFRRMQEICFSINIFPKMYASFIKDVLFLFYFLLSQSSRKICDHVTTFLNWFFSGNICIWVCKPLGAEFTQSWTRCGY